MGRRKAGVPPPYLHHRASGQAYCTVGGKPVYLGKHGSRESRKRYKEVLADWERNRERPAPAACPPRLHAGRTGE